MGTALEQRALEALLNGPPGFGDGPSPGEAVSVARWVGERHAAVLFLRLRRDRIWDGTVVHFKRSEDEWELDIDAGGGWPEPRDRPAEGLDGGHIDRFGSSGTSDVLVFRGQVSVRVTKLVLDPDGVTRSKALGTERMARKLRDALPGGENPLRTAVWEFLRPMLSPTLVALNHDAFIADDRDDSTVDLDKHRSASNLDELDLNDSHEAA